jgi:hypothetical protein
MTPNRLHGPHEPRRASTIFPAPSWTVAIRRTASAYTNSELSRLFSRVGFRCCKHFAGARGLYVRVSPRLM